MSGALVGRKGELHHVGIVVSDLDESIGFYHQLLGIEPDFTVDSSGDHVDAAMQLSDVRIRYAMLPLTSGRLELVQYLHPEGRPFDRTNADTGSTHISFLVDDVAAVHERLVARGISVNCPPTIIRQGLNQGGAYCYFRDPDGYQLEVSQAPQRGTNSTEVASDG